MEFYYCSEFLFFVSLSSALYMLVGLTGHQFDEHIWRDALEKDRKFLGHYRWYQSVIALRVVSRSEGCAGFLHDRSKKSYCSAV